MTKINFGVVGLGQRGLDLVKNVIVHLPDVNISAVCDLHSDRTDVAAAFLKSFNGNAPFISNDYRELLTRSDVDALVIVTGWEDHVRIASDSMSHKKAVAMEVGGAYQITDCYNLIESYEKTRTPFMFLENCCYGKTEMLISNMASLRLFGEIVHCSGSYGHDLRSEIANGQGMRHYRQRNYRLRNCENYPTHELGPIAKILNINHGNRMLSLTSTASKAVGMRDYLLSGKAADEGLDPYSFRQADIVVTNILCADGSTIMLKLDTTLPRHYNREFTVRGTKGGYSELTNCVFIDGEFDEWKTEFNNLSKYEKYLPAVWREYQENTIGSHGGMDYLTFLDFADCLRNNKPMPIDVYDAASWMSVSCLSEQSIINGGAQISIPDFTGGNWLKER